MTTLDQPITELAEAVRSGETSAVALCEAALDHLGLHEALNATIHVQRDAALLRAEKLDEQRRSGRTLGPLAGVPIVLKDNLCTVSAPTTCGSKILLREPSDSSSGWRSPYDATVVTKLEAADAVIIAKANLDEFGMGSSNETSAFGPALNPWDQSRTPGGSSGGCAALTASGLPAALGSDTGGSIRQPAAFCGVTGVKPTHGRVSRYGLVAFASSLDQVGPFARDVRSAACLLGAIAGHDPRDSTSTDIPVDDYLDACAGTANGMRVGVPKEYFEHELDPSVAAATQAGIDALANAGAEVIPVSLPHTRHAVASYYLIAAAEASSNLARFDGVRFGRREEPDSQLDSMYSTTRGAGFGAEVKRRIMLGAYALSAGYYDEYYGRAARVRTLIRRDFERAFEQIDVLAAPVTATPAFKLGTLVNDPLAMYLSDLFTLPASLAGVCGMSVPCGMTPAREDCAALPVGLQLMAGAFQERTLFRMGAAVEDALGKPTMPRSSQ